MSSICCQKLIIEDAFHFHLLSILLIVKIVILLRWIVEIVVICGSLTLNHGLQFVTFLDKLLIKLLQLVPFTDQILHLLGHRMYIILFLVTNIVDLETCYHLLISI